MNTIPKIKNLAQLKQILHSGPGYDGYDVMLKSIDFDASEMKDYCVWNSRHYSRVYLEQGDCFDLVLMCWEKGQETPVHDHNHQEGWIYVLEGELSEVLFHEEGEGNPLKKTYRNVLKEKEIAYINDDIGLHKLQNTFEGRTLSLHLYADPINQTHIYDETTGNSHLKTINKK